MGNAPYDPSTPLGRVRLYCSDTAISVDPATQQVTDNSTFSDAELNAFLTDFGDPISAAGAALLALASDAGKLAFHIKSQGLDVDRTEYAAQLREQSDALFTKAMTGGSIDSPDQVFSTDNAMDGTTGSMSRW